MKQLVFDNFIGGVNLNEATTIKDNELAKAENCFYDDDSRLTSRRGIQDIFQPISDAVTVIASMNTYDGDGSFTPIADAGSVATETSIKKYDAGSVEFVITDSAHEGGVENTGITSVDLTAVKETGYFGLWLYIPAIVKFTSVTLTLGENLDSQDYELAVTTQADGSAFKVGWNFLKFDWASMTADGSPLGVIDEIRIYTEYGTGYAGGTFYADCLSWYSNTYTKAAHSIYHVKLDDGTRVSLAACGTNIFKLENDNDWVFLKGGWTDGEKFSFLNYKSVIHFSNGTDNFSWYTPAFESGAGSIVTADASCPKAKYLMMVANTAYACGISGDLNKLAYSTALPANLANAVWTGVEYIYDDNSREVITGMGKLPTDAIAVFLENSAYYVDTVPSTTVIRPLDYDGGCTSWRTIQRVGNDMFFLSEDSLNSLSQREGTEGTFGASSLSDNVQPRINTGSDLSTSNSFRGRSIMPNHYYLNIDANKSGSPDTCLVYNIKLQAWTEYTNIAANQMIEYEDSDGNWHIVYANIFSGQLREIEKNFDDNGVEINVKIWTKENDFGEPTLYKLVNLCDISGFISQTAEISAIDVIDGEINTTDVIDGDNFSTSSSSYSLGAYSIGSVPLTGQSREALKLNLFNVRKNIYQSTFRTQIRLESATLYCAWVLSKIQFQVDSLPIDFFPTSNYI